MKLSYCGMHSRLNSHFPCELRPLTFGYMLPFPTKLKCRIRRNHQRWTHWTQRFIARCCVAVMCLVSTVSKSAVNVQTYVVLVNSVFNWTRYHVGELQSDTVCSTFALLSLVSVSLNGFRDSPWEKPWEQMRCEKHSCGFQTFIFHVYLQLTFGKFILEKKKIYLFAKAASCYLISDCRE